MSKKKQTECSNQTAFRTWLSRPWRNKGKPYSDRTVDRYVKAIARMNPYLMKWGIELDENGIFDVSKSTEYLVLEQRIRELPEFQAYNNDEFDDPTEKSNGTGVHDPSAALNLYGQFLQDQTLQLPHKSQPSVDSDILLVALMLFQRDRSAEIEGMNVDDWPSYDAWAKEVRKRFATIDAGTFADTAFDYAGFMQRYIYSERVANAYFKNHSPAEKIEVGNFISQNRIAPHAVSWYLEPENRPQVAGMGVGVMLNFMMKVRPAEFATYSALIDQMLLFTGLAKTVSPHEITVENYEANKALQGRVLAKMRELSIGQAADDNSPADYLTVNEFAWWLSDERNRTLVKEEVMATQLKTEKPTKYDESKRQSLTFNAGDKDDELLLRLMSALRAKPFVILAGHSGTGKSRYVKKLAYMTCNANELRQANQLPGNYLILQVKPNWHDSTDLLGFRNAMQSGQYQKTALIEFLFKALHFKDTPFFLCLDEMNLAPVEQYFAEFLSAMESVEPVPLNDITENEPNLLELGCVWKDAYETLKERKFSIPQNLFIVGTVNMDETTNQFSRKVLDRAFTIEMTDVDFTTFDGNHDKTPSYADTIDESMIQSLLNRKSVVEKLDDEDRKDDSPLIKVQQQLAATPFAIAYRFASEYTLLKGAIAVFDPQGAVGLDALDQAVLMKILPRIAGECDYIRKIYGEKENEGLRGALKNKKSSLAKIQEILNRATNTGAPYITFWP